MISVNVVRWLAGYGTGLLGEQLYYITLAWTAAQVASPTQLGLILAAGAVPRALFLLFGGAIADRIGPKPVALASDTARFLALTVLTAAAFMKMTEAHFLIGFSILFGFLSAMFLPATGAMPPLLVASTHLAKVQAARSLLQRLALVTGPPIAGLLLVQAGAPIAFGVAAMLTLVSIAALFLTKLHGIAGVHISQSTEPYKPASSLEEPVRDASGEHRVKFLIIEDVRAGLSYVLHHKVLLPLLMVTAVAEIAVTGPITAGVPLLAVSRQWGAEGLGFVLAGFGLGATVTALIIMMVGKVPYAGRIALSSVIIMGPSLAAVGTAADLPVAVAAGVATGLCGGICGTLISTFVMTVCESTQMGRVLSLVSLATLGGAPLSIAVTGLYVQATEPSNAFVAGGVLVTCVGVIAFWIPSLRRAQLVDPAATHSQPTSARS